jgi:Cys-rich repeat protein
MPQGVNILATLVRGPSNSNQIINSTIGSVTISSSENNDIINCNITSTGTGVSIGEGIPPFTSRNNKISDSRINGAAGIYLGPSQSTAISNTVIASTGQDFVSASSRGNDIITNLTFNSSGYPVKTSFAYSGDISITSVNASAPNADNLKNMSKYLNITNQSAASVALNISYSDYDSRFVDESTLKIYKYNGTNWILANTTSSLNGVDKTAKIVYANINSFSIFAPMGNPDKAAPIITIINPLQNAVFAAGTANTTINISTDEIAECRYNQTDSNFTFSNGNSFTNTNSISHSFLFTGMSDGQSYALYYKCEDSSGNVNDNSTAHSFSVASAPTPTPPAGGGARATKGAIVCTDECISGAKECISTNAFRTCADYNLNGCTEWQSASCSAGEICDPATAECAATVPSPPEAECIADSDCSSGEKCVNGKCAAMQPEIEKPAIPFISYVGIALGIVIAIILVIIIRDIIILTKKKPGITVKAGARHLPGKRQDFPEIRSKAGKIRRKRRK